LGTAATTGLIGDGDCGEIGGIKIGRGNRSTRNLWFLFTAYLPTLPSISGYDAPIGSIISEL
jgi:hypothetical protein